VATDDDAPGLHALHLLDDVLVDGLEHLEHAVVDVPCVSVCACWHNVRFCAREGFVREKTHTAKDTSQPRVLSIAAFTYTHTHTRSLHIHTHIPGKISSARGSGL
jgi:hypothetical protein